MAIATVQTKTASTGAGTAGTLPVTFDSAPTQGNLIVGVAGGNRTMTNAAYSTGVSSVDFVGLYLWYKVAGPSESATVTPTLASTGRGSIWVGEFSGLATTSPLDQSASSTPGTSGVNAIASGTTSTLAQADELVIVGFCITTAVSVGATTISGYSNGFTQAALLTTSGDDSPLLGVALQVVSATTAQSSTATLSTDVEGHPSGIIASFKAGTVGPLLSRLTTIGPSYAAQRAASY